MTKATKSSLHRRSAGISTSKRTPASTLRIRPARIRPDANEQEILDSVERGEWRSVENIKRDKIRYRTYAKPMDFKRRPF